MKKECRKCLVLRDQIDYFKNKANKDGLTSYCKICYKGIDKSSAGKAIRRNYILKKNNSVSTKDFITFLQQIDSKKLNILIELKKVKSVAKLKTLLHKNRLIKEKKGIKLLQFFDFEWATRKPQVKSFIKAALGKNTIKLHGRNTEFKTVSKLEASEFLETYHILGTCNFKYAYGLYYNNEIVSLITLGLHHRGTGELILSRYCGKENVSVLGGLSKLCKHAYGAHGSFSTWIDLRFSDGYNWIKTGWKCLSTLKPDYFYYSRDNKVISKQSRRKSIVKTPISMTEYQHAIKDGLCRIYDCGKIKLQYYK